MGSQRPDLNISLLATGPNLAVLSVKSKTCSGQRACFSTFTTTTGGETWEPLSSPLSIVKENTISRFDESSGRSCFSSATDFGEKATMFCATAKDFPNYKEVPLSIVSDNSSVSYAGGSTILAIEDSQFLRSDDMGTTWTLIFDLRSLNPTNSLSRPLGAAAAFGNDHVLACLTTWKDNPADQRFWLVWSAGPGTKARVREISANPGQPFAEASPRDAALRSLCFSPNGAERLYFDPDSEISKQGILRRVVFGSQGGGMVQLPITDLF